MTWTVEENKIQGLRSILHTSSERNESIEHVTLEQLAARPDPVAMGRWHYPIRYDDIVRTTDQVLLEQGIETVNRELVLARDGKLLIGVNEVQGEVELELPGGVKGRTLLAYMASEGQLTSFKLKAGSQVSVCDNLLLSAQSTLVMHKFTSKAQILNRIKDAILGWRRSEKTLEMKLNTLNTWELSDDAARKEILEIGLGDPVLATRGVIAPKYMAQAYDEYFKPTGEDTTPRTRFGLLNAWTRSLREAPVQSRIQSTVALSAHFNI